MSRSSETWTVLRMLEWGTDYFQQKGINSPRMSIEWLLSDVLAVKRLDLYLMYDRPLAPDELDQIRPLIKRRAEHEPLQYITGSTPFVHANIKVNEHVLIPRMETEYMVELILERFGEETNLRVLDIATGAGCIPVALKMKRPGWIIDAFDISDDALKLARENAELNECEVHFFQEDLFDFKGSDSQGYDLITSNPPYVLWDEKESLDPEVVKYEPHLALFTESTDDMYNSLSGILDKCLNPGGFAYLELNAAEAQNVLNMSQRDGWKSTLKVDQEGRNRFLIVERSV